MHTFSAAAMAVITAVSNFYKDQSRCIAHDQIDFTDPAVEISLNRGQPPGDQELFGNAFPLRSFLTSQHLIQVARLIRA